MMISMQTSFPTLLRKRVMDDQRIAILVIIALLLVGAKVVIDNV
jgi:hypothetical protein